MRADVGFEGSRRGRAIAYVELQHASVPAKRDDLALHGIGLVAAAAAVHDDVEPVAREAHRNGLSDSAAGSRYECRVGHAFFSLSI